VSMVMVEAGNEDGVPWPGQVSPTFHAISQ
jgi:hypothetical protein